MENAVDALKMAFAVFVFIMAIVLTINIFGQIRQTSDMVLSLSDRTNFYEYVEENDNNARTTRVVGVETIIPMLYRYTNEALSIVIKDQNGQIIQVFDVTIEADIKRNTDANVVNSFRNCVVNQGLDWTPWLGNADYIRKRVDLFVGGTSDKTVQERTINGTEMNYGEGFLEQYRNAKFKESFQEKLIIEDEDAYDEDLTGGVSAVSKITITYELI